MQMSIIALIIVILIPLSALVGFGIQAFTGRLPPHSWLFGVSLLSWLLLIVEIALAIVSPSQNLPVASAVVVVGFLLVFFVAWISGLVIAARERHWGWFIALLVTLGYGVIFFCIFARPMTSTTSLAQR